MSRRELQALAKKCGITANLSSAVIIEKILLQRPCVREHDILQQFKKDCEVLSSEHMAALNSVSMKAASAMGVLAGFSPDVAENAARSMAVRREFVEFVAKVRSDLVEAQRTMTKRYEAELSEVASGKAELQSEVAEVAAPKLLAVSNAKVDGIDVKATTAVAYAAIYVGRLSKKVTNVQLQEVFDTNASVGRYYSKGIAKVLVPLDQLEFHGV